LKKQFKKLYIRRGFATTSEVNYEGNSLPVLPVGIFDNAEFLGAKLETGLAKEDGTALTDRLTFSFKTADGSPFSHSELKPDEGKEDFDKKSTNLSKRVGHILSKFYPKEALVQQNTTWEGYAAWVVNMANGANKTQKVKLAIAGSVYDGKGRTGFPGYPPFIKKAGEDLSFDQNHLRSNKEYEDFMSAKADTTGASAGAAGVTGIKGAF
jgi:hypothetical protein